MAEERTSRPSEEGTAGDASGAWSPRPFLHGTVAGFFLGCYVAVLAFYLLPASLKKWPSILLVLPVMMLQQIALLFVRPSREEMRRRAEYFRRRLGGRAVRILTAAAISLVGVGVMEVLGYAFFEWPGTWVGVGLLLGGVLVAMSAGPATSRRGAR